MGRLKGVGVRAGDRDDSRLLLPCTQDFYSHSNWVELGQQQPHPHLLWPRQELRSLARGTAMTLVLRETHRAESCQPTQPLCHILRSHKM